MLTRGIFNKVMCTKLQDVVGVSARHTALNPHINSLATWLNVMLLIAILEQ